MLAQVHDGMGRYLEAERELLELTKLAPNDPMLLNNLGYHLVEQGKDLPEALDMIQRALERSPGDSAILDSLGWAYFKLGNLVLAERYIVEALKGRPTSAEVLDHLGDLYLRQGKRELALEKWREALRHSYYAGQTAARLKQKVAENDY